MPTQKLTNEIIAAAIDGFEAQKRKIDEQIRELRAMMAGRGPEAAAAKAAPAAPVTKKRRMSAAGRRAIAEATRKRWAAFHAAKAAEEKATRNKTARKKAAAKKAATRKAPVRKVVAKKAPSAAPQSGTETAAQ